MPLLGGSDEKPKNSNRTVEILKLPKVDILLGSSVSPQTRTALIQEFQNGLPASYVRYKKMNIYVNSSTHPVLLVKQRYFGAKEVRKFRETGKHYYDARELNAASSLTNELTLVPKVKQILQTPEAQRFAKDYGYEGIKLVEPLLGLIERSTGNKFMVFPFVAGKEWEKSSPARFDIDENLVKKLRAIFEAHGISPIDLAGKQILIDGKTMYLLDTEIYYEMPPIKK